ncbi:hypothetical protein FPV67DRAFT_1673054 [Lyophyllum atratum]|nr:hypothetical protein FPV67DRAFT_1673054 [Lyophyllum atratum]
MKQDDLYRQSHSIMTISFGYEYHMRPALRKGIKVASRHSPSPPPNTTLYRLTMPKNATKDTTASQPPDTQLRPEDFPLPREGNFKASHKKAQNLLQSAQEVLKSSREEQAAKTKGNELADLVESHFVGWGTMPLVGQVDTPEIQRGTWNPRDPIPTTVAAFYRQLDNGRLMDSLNPKHAIVLAVDLSALSVPPSKTSDAAAPLKWVREAVGRKGVLLLVNGRHREELMKKQMAPHTHHISELKKLLESIPKSKEPNGLTVTQVHNAIQELEAQVKDLSQWMVKVYDLTALEKDKRAADIRVFLAANPEIYGLADSSDNACRMILREIAGCSAKDARARIDLAMDYSITNNSKLRSVFLNTSWALALADLHQFEGIPRSACLYVNFQYETKNVGIPFAFHFLQATVIMYQILSSTSIEFEDFDFASAPEDHLLNLHAALILRFKESPMESRGVIDHGFLDTSFFAIVTEMFSKHLALVSARGGEPINCNSNRPGGRSWDRAFTPYAAELIESVDRWIAEQRMAYKEDKYRLKLLEQLPNKLRWVLHGQVIRLSGLVPQLKTKLPVMELSFLRSVMQDMHTVQFAVNQVLAWFEPFYPYFVHKRSKETTLLDVLGDLYRRQHVNAKPQQITTAVLHILACLYAHRNRALTVLMGLHLGQAPGYLSDGTAWPVPSIATKPHDPLYTVLRKVLDQSTKGSSRVQQEVLDELPEALVPVVQSALSRTGRGLQDDINANGSSNRSNRLTTVTRFLHLASQLSSNEFDGKVLKRHIVWQMLSDITGPCDKNNVPYFIVWFGPPAEPDQSESERDDDDGDSDSISADVSPNDLAILDGRLQSEKKCQDAMNTVLKLIKTPGIGSVMAYSDGKVGIKTRPDALKVASAFRKMVSTSLQHKVKGERGQNLLLPLPQTIQASIESRIPIPQLERATDAHIQAYFAHRTAHERAMINTGQLEAVLAAAALEKQMEEDEDVVELVDHPTSRKRRAKAAAVVGVVPDSDPDVKPVVRAKKQRVLNKANTSRSRVTAEVIEISSDDQTTPPPESGKDVKPVITAKKRLPLRKTEVIVISSSDERSAAPVKPAIKPRKQKVKAKVKSAARVMSDSDAELEVTKKSDSVTTVSAVAAAVPAPVNVESASVDATSPPLAAVTPDASAEEGGGAAPPVSVNGAATPGVQDDVAAAINSTSSAEEGGRATLTVSANRDATPQDLESDLAAAINSIFAEARMSPEVALALEEVIMNRSSSITPPPNQNASGPEMESFASDDSETPLNNGGPAAMDIDEDEGLVSLGSDGGEVIEGSPRHKRIPALNPWIDDEAEEMDGDDDDEEEEEEEEDGEEDGYDSGLDADGEDDVEMEIEPPAASQLQ